MRCASSRVRPCSSDSMLTLLATWPLWRASHAARHGRDAHLAPRSTGPPTTAGDGATSTTARRELRARDAGRGGRRRPVSAQVTEPLAEHHVPLPDRRRRRPGEDMTFTTEPNPTPPGVSKQRRERRDDRRRATSRRRSTPTAPQTTYYFQYGRTTSYGRTPDPVGRRGHRTAITVAAALTGLRPYTRYHWQLVARNAAGTHARARPTFTTGPARRPRVTLSAVAQDGPVRPRRDALGGRVSGAGVNGMTRRAEQQRFPFDSRLHGGRHRPRRRDGGYLFTIDHALGRDPLPRRHAHRRRRSRARSPSPGARSRSAARPGTLTRKRARDRGHDPARRARHRVLQRRIGKRWRQVGRQTIAPADSLRSRYRFKVWRAHKVDQRFRVVALPVRGAYVRGWSRSRCAGRQRNPAG